MLDTEVDALPAPSGSGLQPLHYFLDTECPITWPEGSTVDDEYPLELPKSSSGGTNTQTETLGDFVVRSYLETLWLPPSISPLEQVVHSLKRAAASPSSFPSTHPLHAALEPVLLDLAAIESKYHEHLPLIINEGGGSGDIEEMMMWYAWNTAKAAEGDVDEELWKRGWLTSMERREVMLQILMHFTKLSLPPPGPDTTSMQSKKRRRKNRSPSPPPAASTEENLENLMDRLCIWQNLEADIFKRQGKDRDWVQIFCEDVMAPLFKTSFPDHYAYLESNTVPPPSRSPSPPPPDLVPKRPRKIKIAIPASPLSHADLERKRTPILPDLLPPPRQHGGTVRPRSRSPSESECGIAPASSSSIFNAAPSTSTLGKASTGFRRSVSVISTGSTSVLGRGQSISATASDIRARGGNRGGIVTNKKLFSEVEMRPRVMKHKLKPQPSKDNREKNVSLPAESVTFVFDTPVKGGQSRAKQEEEPPSLLFAHSSVYLPDSPPDEFDSGARENGLVVDTPVKRRKIS